MTDLSKEKQEALNNFVKKLTQQNYTQTLPNQLDSNKKDRSRLKKLQTEADQAVAALLKVYPEAFALTNIYFEYYQSLNLIRATDSLLAIAVKKSYPFCKSLLDAGFSVNMQNDKGDTALHRLAKRTGDNDSDVIQLLKERGANFNILNNDKKTAFSVIQPISKGNLLALCPDVLIEADCIKIASLSDKMFRALLTKPMVKEAILSKRDNIVMLAKQAQNKPLLQYFSNDPETWLSSQNPLENIRLQITATPIQLIPLQTITGPIQLMLDASKLFTEASATNFSKTIKSFKNFIAQQEISQDSKDEQEAWLKKEINHLIPQLLQYVGSYFFDVMRKYKARKNKKDVIRVKHSPHAINFDKLWENEIVSIFQFLARKLKELEKEREISFILKSEIFNTDICKQLGQSFDLNMEKTQNSLTEFSVESFVSNNKLNKIQNLLLRKLINIPDFGKLILLDLYNNMPDFLANLMCLPNSASLYLVKDMNAIILKDIAENDEKNKHTNPKIQNALKLQLLLTRNSKKYEYLKSAGNAFHQSLFKDSSIAVLPSDVYALIFMFWMEVDFNIFDVLLSVNKKLNKIITELDNNLTEENWRTQQYRQFGKFNKELKCLIKNKEMEKKRFCSTDLNNAIQEILNKIQWAFSEFLFIYLRKHNISVETAYNASHPADYLKLMFDFDALWQYKEQVIHPIKQVEKKLELPVIHPIEQTDKQVDVSATKTQINMELLLRYDVTELEKNPQEELPVSPFIQDEIEMDQKTQERPEENAALLCGKRKYEQFALLSFLQEKKYVKDDINNQPVLQSENTEVSIGKQAEKSTKRNPSSNFNFFHHVDSPLDIFDRINTKDSVVQVTQSFKQEPAIKKRRF